ncbi:gliding motility protein SprC [Flavobacterium pectinovorum]|uniref:gliding motility protein SprC n=1 Tax=Flavobacterium pectinovorum TaxID=29533 RepID=UPI00293E6A58|nr:gliding motility protein SprC [Flavobacterium pectinovorum]MCI9846074.1 gliding motility protein SprC [Flavobacterium pectinovorum]
MMKKTTLSLIKSLLFLGVFFFTVYQSNAQAIISASKSDFVNICAGDFVNGKPFNEYYASFAYSGFPADVTFAVEISDENGNFLASPVFANTLEVTTISATQQKIKFAIPVDLKGSDGYSLRIRSNNGINSQRIRNFGNNDSYSIYYKNYVDLFSINNQSATASFCSGGSMTLSIDNPTPAVKESSPVNYPNLKYIWYKDEVVVSGQSAASLTVNTPGSYYAKIDYGKCSENNWSSNRVTVTSSSGSGASVSISSSLGNPFCADGGNTILTATSGNSYIWKKDGVVISGVTSRTYATNEAGVYTVDVNFGGCSGSAKINLISNSFDASIDVAEETTINEGETLSVSVTDDAASPTYEWYLNGNLIAGATGDTYLVSFRGNYRVKISQAGGCISSKEFSFKVNGPPGLATVIPNIIKLSDSPYWNIPDVYRNENTKVIIISSNGEKVLDVVNYQSDWPQSGLDIKNVNPVYYYVIKGDAGEKKGSITVLK